MIGGYTAETTATQEYDGRLKIKRDLADTRWSCNVLFYAEGDFSFRRGRLGFDAPPDTTFKETTVPAMIDAEPNPALKRYFLGEDPEANALKILEDYPEVSASLPEWFNGREDLGSSHLPLTGRNVVVYDVPANTSLLSVKGPRWTPHTVGSRCYFAFDPPRQFMGDVWATPSNGSHAVNITNLDAGLGGVKAESDLDWSVVSSSVGFGRPKTSGIDSVDVLQPILHYDTPTRAVTAGEAEHTWEPGPTIQDVRLFFSRLDPTVKYTLTIGSQDSICVFHSLEVVQQDKFAKIEPNNDGSGNSSAGSGPPDGGNSHSGGLSGGAIAGIVVGCVVGVALLLLLGFCCWRRRKSTSKGEDFEIADVSTHESKPLAEMGAPTPIMPRGDFPGRHTASQTSQDGFATTSGTGTNTVTLETLGTLGTNSTSSNTMGQHTTLPPTVVRHEEDAGSLEAELPEGTRGGEVVLPPVYRDEWVDRRAGRGLGISTDVARSDPSALTAEEIKYLGPPTPGATLSSPITPGSSSGHTFGHWMNQPLSPGARVSPTASQPLSPLSTTPAGKTPLHPLQTLALSQPGSSPHSPATTSPTYSASATSPTSPLESQPTGSVPETNPLVTPFPSDIQPSDNTPTTPNGFPKDLKQ